MTRHPHDFDRLLTRFEQVLERDLIADHCRHDSPARVKTRLAILTRADAPTCVTVVAAGQRGQGGPYSLNLVRGDCLTTDSVFVLDDAQLRELDSRNAVHVGDVHVELMRVQSEDLYEWLMTTRASPSDCTDESEFCPNCGARLFGPGCIEGTLLRPGDETCTRCRPVDAEELAELESGDSE